MVYSNKCFFKVCIYYTKLWCIKKSIIDCLKIHKLVTVDQPFRNACYILESVRKVDMFAKR